MELNLRIAAPRQDESGATDSPAETDASPGIGLGMRVLIVDDERDTVMTLGILLRSEGFVVQLAQSGVVVADLVRRFRPRAVLLDIEMPDLDGYAVADGLRKEHGNGCPVLIAVTAHGKQADRDRAMSNGFSHHVPKPYSPDELLKLLASLQQQPS